ncbi:hypothetical protein A6R68_01273, partial [Neotoma lepida]
MAMALHRVRIAEKYGKNYLSLLQAVFWAETELLLQSKDINHFLMHDIAFLSGLFPRGQASFPGSLHLVLVLRPTSFLQRTFTDIGFRFSQQDFMLKLPVVMLSSVSDLLTYIDDKQLTPELGGTLQYCYSEWIIFRNAIEKFAVTVKEMAQMLQSFGTELAETELPDDIPLIEEILAIRAERLLAQVHDMETAFDGFWEKHKLKMEQYLKLWKFEQDFQEELLAQARLVILHGHKLASNHHYALDLICQRCNELRYLSDVLVSEIRAKQIQLSRIFKIHKLLQQARKCCDQGECLLANQGVAKFQTKEDAQKAIQDVENFLQMAVPFINYDIDNLQYEFDVLLSPELKIEVIQDSQQKRNSDESPRLDNSLDILKNHVLNELIQTERAYVQELFTGYRSEMDNPQMFALMPPLLRNKKDVLFGNMAEIYEFHNNIFMSSLENCFNAPERVGPCFLERKDDFQMYAKYCQNKPRSELIWRKYSKCDFFQELLKYSKEGEGTTQLKEALDTMLDLLKSLNDSMHQIAIDGYL